MSMNTDDYTTAGTGDGSELPVYNEAFGLLSKDGSGNPPANLTQDQVASKIFYKKDKDIVQNMRNLMALVQEFKEQVNALEFASGYGGWAIIVDGSEPQDRVDGLMYFRVLNASEENNQDNMDAYFHVEAELSNGKKLKFRSDASLTSYTNTESYNLTSNTVEKAINELSKRSIALYATIYPANWSPISSNGNSGTVLGYKAVVAVDEMLETDFPMVTTNISSLTGDAESRRICTEAGFISRIVTKNGKIEAYCYGTHQPSETIPLIFRVMRGWPR